MSDRPIAIASDHAGFHLKQQLIDELREMGMAVTDLGTGDGQTSVDYPDFAQGLAAALRDGPEERGVLICGTGLGISIAANRHPWVRAAVCHDETTARLSREHNDANVLVLGARIVGIEVAKGCLRTFLETPFEGGRHQRRIDKMGPAA